MTTAAQTPTYPAPGRESTVTFTLTEAGANFVRVWCTVAPDGSKLAADIATAPDGKVHVYEGPGGADHPMRFKPDKGGAYTLVCREYKKGTGFRGAYQDDPRGKPSETQLPNDSAGSMTTLVVYAGQKITMPIGAPPDTATLTFWTWNDTIRATNLALHGEVTPSIAAAASARAATAAKDTTVATALAALVDVVAETARGSNSTLATLSGTVITKILGHYALTAGGVHAAADNDNKLDYSVSLTTLSPQASQVFVNKILESIRRHETNDKDGSGPGSAATAYHQISSTNVADYGNRPLFTTVNSPEQAYGGWADFIRCFETHRVSTAVHGAADNTNTIGTIPKLMTVHRDFLAVVATSSPTPAPGDTTAAALLRAWGAKVQN